MKYLNIKDNLPFQAIKIYEAVSKGAIYFLVFLLPLFFLPWTADILDFNKQALLLTLALISLFAWTLKALVLGRFSLRLNIFHILVIVLFFVFLFSTIFSLWSYGSFWGRPLVVSESLLSIISFILIYFLIINIFEKKEIPRLINSLVLSSSLAIVLGIFQFFGKSLIPIKAISGILASTVGSFNQLALFSAVLTPLIIFLLVAERKKILKILFILVLALNIFSLILFNFQTAWWIVITGAILIMIWGTQRSDVFDNRWLVLPMFLLAISLFFVFFKIQIPGTPPPSIEITVTHKTSFDIVLKSLKERPLLGSGPGTFSYDFLKHKDINSNQGPFWNISFDRARSKILTVLATTGALGVASFLALIGFFAIYGIGFFFPKLNIFFAKKALFKKGTSKSFENEKLLKKSGKEEEEEKKEREKQENHFFWSLKAGIFISFLALSVAYFLYYSNLTLDFIFFLLAASFIVLTSLRRKEFILKPSSLPMLIATFVFTSIFIFGLGLFLLEGQRYVAEINYLQGVKQKKLDDIETGLRKTIRINSKTDTYWRELSQVYIEKIKREAKRKDIPKEETNKKIQGFIMNAINSSKKAVDINPKNSANWSIRALVYQNLIGAVAGVDDWSLDSYKKAAELEPSNPYYPTQIGTVYLRKISLLSSDAYGKKEELFNNVEASFKKALDLKPDYVNALYLLGLTYKQENKKEEALGEFQKILALNPNNQNVRQIIKNLKAPAAKRIIKPATEPKAEPKKEEEK